MVLDSAGQEGQRTRWLGWGGNIRLDITLSVYSLPAPIPVQSASHRNIFTRQQEICFIYEGKMRLIWDLIKDNISLIFCDTMEADEPSVSLQCGEMTRDCGVWGHDRAPREPPIIQSQSQSVYNYYLLHQLRPILSLSLSLCALVFSHQRLWERMHFEKV